MKFDVNFSVGLINKNQPLDENVVDEHGEELAYKLLKGKTEFSTFKGAYKNALKLRSLYKEHEVVIIPMFNTLDKDGYLFYGVGNSCLSILPDGTIIPLNKYFIEGVKQESKEGE